MKGIDHLVLCTDDLDRVGDKLARLGFSVTPHAYHPFGTANRLVQLQGSFLEFVIIADQSLIPQSKPGHFSFSGFSQEFIERHTDGFAMLVLDSHDARADQRRYEAAGLDTYAPFDFSRKAKLPDGAEVTVGFSLAFTTHPSALDAAFFSCQQHAPEHFWKPEYQSHKNTAKTIEQVTIVAEHPAELAEFLAEFSGCSAESGDDSSVVLHSARGVIAVVKPARFEAEYACKAPSMERGPRLAGYQIGVADEQALGQCLEPLGIGKSDGKWNVEPAMAGGTALSFVSLQEQVKA